MSKKECIAMLLAGGQGSRLGALTSNVAKPAVSFGGKFRIIDFALSNCANSGINTVGVGQVEAARSLGMSFNRILAKIVIPQALRSSVLPMTNLFIAVMLTTALGSQVPLKPQELTGVVSYINTRSLGGVAAFFISALGYLGTAFVVSHIGNYIDKKVRILR